jgi:hypothetical protein
MEEQSEIQIDSFVNREAEIKSPRFEINNDSEQVEKREMILV